MGRPAATAAKKQEPEFEDDLDLGPEDAVETSPKGASPATPAVSSAGVGSLLDAAPPPPPAVPKGSPATPFGDRPEDAIPALIEKTYLDRGQRQTGNAYAADIRKFLSWLRAKSLSLSSMPPGSAQQFLVEVYRNPLMRNRAITGLTMMFEQAQAQGITFLPQEMERTRVGRSAKNAAMGVTTVSGPPALAQPVAPINTTAQPAVSGAPVVPAPPPPPPKPPQMPKPVSVFPSLGQRIQIALIANGHQQGIAPGTKIPINTYQKEQIEAAGSMENFLMLYMRPTYGPFAGEPPTSYYFQQLDTSGRPLPGADWTVTIMPSEVARPALGAPASATPSMLQLPSVLPGAPAAVQGDLIARLLEREFQRADREAQEAKAQREALEDKRNKGQISDMVFLALSQQIPQPRPVDPAEVARRVREELDRLQPPAVGTPLPGTPSTLDLGTPREDPSMGRVMALLEKLLERQMQPPPPPPPQKDPVMSFGEMLALFEKARPPPNPLEQQLAALALRGITDPPKARTTMELIQELKALKEAGSIIGGDSPPPTLVEGLVSVVQAVTENAEALGAAIGRIRSGAVSGAFEATKQKRLQDKTQPTQQPQAQQTQQPVLPSQVTREKMVAMCNGIQAGDEDQKIVENLLGVIKQLSEDPDPTGMDRWRRFSQAVQNRYLNAESPQEIQGLVFWFFEQLGAGKLYTKFPKVLERLCQTLTDNYPVIYALLTGGKEKTLPAVQAQAAAQAQAATVSAVPPMAPPLSEDDSGGEEEDEGSAEEEVDQQPEHATVG